MFNINNFDPKFIRNSLKNSGLPNLWIPSENAFYALEEIPILGNGKVDLLKIKKTALAIADKNQMATN